MLNVPLLERYSPHDVDNLAIFLTPESVASKDLQSRMNGLFSLSEIQSCTAFSSLLDYLGGSKLRFDLPVTK